MAGSDGAGEGDEHAGDPEEQGPEAFPFLGRDHVKARGDVERGGAFEGGARSDHQVPGLVRTGAAAVCLRDIERHGADGPVHLPGEVLPRPAEPVREPIDSSTSSSASRYTSSRS